MTKKIHCNPYNDAVLIELLEYASKDEAKGIEFYTNFLNSLPVDKYYDDIRRVINKIIDEEEKHLAWLSQLIDRV